MGNLSRLIGKKFTGSPRFAIADIIARKAASHAARRNELTAHLAARLRARVAIIAIAVDMAEVTGIINAAERDIPPPPAPAIPGNNRRSVLSSE